MHASSLSKVAIAINLLSFLVPVVVASTGIATSWNSSDAIIPDIDWQPCKDPHKPSPDVQCGSFDVPLNWHDASAGKGKLSVVRLPATAKRKGTIFVDSGVIASPPSTKTWMFTFGPALVNRTNGHYDIVVWDPRGVGHETFPGAFDCFESSREREIFWARSSFGHQFSGMPNMPADLAEAEHRERALVYHTTYEALINTCMRRVSATKYSEYTGMAASVRDLIALADYLDGPNSAINFWGMSYGSLIGSYLINMFPDRIGRVILDSPMDPIAYTSRPPHEVWLDEILAANGALESFADDCEYDITTCHIIRAGNHSPEFEIRIHELFLAQLRATYIGWRLHNDVHNPHMRDFFSRIYPASFPNTTDISTMVSSSMQKITQHEHRLLDTIIPGIGILQTYCADAIDSNGTTAQNVKRTITGNRNAAPILGPLFPSMRYLCHLWPVRAVERYSGPFNHHPDTPVLVVGTQLNPIDSVKHARRVSESLGGRTFYIEQEGFGIPSFGHSKCVRDILVDYLADGTLPFSQKIICKADGVRDDTRASTFFGGFFHSDPRGILGKFFHFYHWNLLPTFSLFYRGSLLEISFNLYRKSSFGRFVHFYRRGLTKLLLLLPLVILALLMNIVLHKYVCLFKLTGDGKETPVESLEKPVTNERGLEESA